MRCYCRAINDGCMATYQLPAGLVLSLKPSCRFIRQKRPATSAGFLLDEHLHRDQSLHSSKCSDGRRARMLGITSRCPSRSLLVVGPKLLAVEMNEVELSASRCVMVRRTATSVGIAAFVAQ